MRLTQVNSRPNILYLIADDMRSEVWLTPQRSSVPL
jgi:hypothetical protein